MNDHDRAKKIILDRTKAAPVAFGSPGYALPSLKTLHVMTLRAAAAKHQTIKVTGPADDSNLIALPDGGILRSMTVNTSPKTKNALIMLDHDLTLVCTVSLYHENQTVVLGGGLPTVGHSGQVNIKIFNDGGLFYWGRGTTSNGVNAVVSGNGCSIIIGDDCMFASGIGINTTDQHAVISMTTGLQTNIPAGILIEPHVWVCQHASIQKGVTVGLGSIVAERSVLSRDVPRFSAFGGVPAKCIKSDCSWDRFGVARAQTAGNLRALASTVPDPQNTKALP